VNWRLIAFEGEEGDEGQGLTSIQAGGGKNLSTTMGALDPDAFLGELAKLFDTVKDKGSLYITLKRSKW